MTSLAIDSPRMQGLTAGAVKAALKSSNPKAPASELSMMAEIISLVSNVVAELPKAERSELVREKDQVRRMLIEAVGRGEARLAIKAKGRIEKSTGTGLGVRVSREEGRERLERYATAQSLESWAGPVAGAGEVEELVGIPRSTLSVWQRRGSVVGLLRGERKLAYPLEQFVDGRPLEGIADVLHQAPTARAAWLWLRQPHGALGDRLPLDALKAGERAAVKVAVERDFA